MFTKFSVFLERVSSLTPRVPIERTRKEPRSSVRFWENPQILKIGENRPKAGKLERNRPKIGFFFLIFFSYFLDLWVSLLCSWSTPCQWTYFEQFLFNITRNFTTFSMATSKHGSMRKFHDSTSASGCFLAFLGLKNAKKHPKRTLWGTRSQVPKDTQKALRGALSSPGP